MSDLAPSSSPPRFDPRRRRAVTIALALVTALAALEGTIVSTAMPTIIGDLNGLALYSWVFSLYLLTATVTMPLYGRLADLYGRRRILLIAIVLFVSGAVACALARSMEQLIVARGFQGLGAGGLLPVAITVVADLYDLRERARIQGLFSGIWGAASLIGPMLGALLTLTFGWRSIFSVNVPLGLVALGLVATQMRESRPPRSDPFDLAGGLALGVGVTAALAAVIQGRFGEWDVVVRWTLAAAAIGSIAAFVRLQSRRSHPLIPPALFTRGETIAPYAAGALLGTTIFGVDAFVPLFVQGARGGTAAAAGAVVTPIVLLWAASAAVAARAIVAWGYRATARVGAVLILVGLAGLIVAAGSGAGIAWISAACALIGTGLGPSSMSQMLAIQYVAHEGERGVATSLVPFSRAVGGALGVGALGTILAAGLARHLGPAADAAGRLLTGHPGSAAMAGVSATDLRHAVERSLLPVFVLLLGLAAVNVLVTAWYPGRVAEEASAVPRPAA
jgi:MFS family permease